MPRDLALGNGNTLVTFDHGLNMRDLYYPYVGLNNHICGHRNRIGLWVEGHFSWLDERGWDRKLGYRKESLISEVKASNSQLGLVLHINDLVHYRENIFLKKIKVVNNQEKSREVRIFLSHDFSINETDIGDTAAYDPVLKAIYHYKRNRYFLINGSGPGGGIFQYAIGMKRFGGAEGTWRDAEDGQLEENPIAQGSVDSTVSFMVPVPAQGEATLYYWLVMGESFGEVRDGNSFVLEKTPAVFLDEVASYWQSWVNKNNLDFADLPPQVVDLFKLSLLVIRTQIDNGGAILAANDSDVLMFHRDHYSYVWPRDGALVAHAMDKAGYPEVTKNFYLFCAGALTEGGYLLHKYNADGTLGSSWHPWVRDGNTQLPIQEDETALVLYALGYYYERERDLEFIDSLYPALIAPAADFLARYRDPGTRLPLPSYDLWEERHGIFTFTCASVYAGLHAAARFAEIFGDRKSFGRWQKAAEEVREAMLRYLYSPELGRFLRCLYVNKGELNRDLTMDSSITGIVNFGVWPPEERVVASTMAALEESLWIKTNIGGVARYTNDYYFQRSHDIENVPGNPWFICTLWLAQWYAKKAGGQNDLSKARKILEWATNYTMESGVLSEQIHPYTGEPLSVAPLTWSHATFVLAVMDYLDKAKAHGQVH